MQTIRKIIKWYFPLRDFLYLLQLEEYNATRYLTQLRKRYFKRNFEKRGTLDLTQRVHLVSLTTSVLVSLLVLSTWFYPDVYTLIVLASIPLLTPFAVLVASVLVTPIVTLKKRSVLKRTREDFLRDYPNTKVIAITGSYGKTTTKYLLNDLLKHTYSVAYIPENINTTLGIAQHLQSEPLLQNTEYLIVEMGAYTEGDIAECTLLLPPDIAVLTKLGDQHIERFGSFKNLVKAKYEIFKYAKSKGRKYTTTEAYNILREHKLAVDDVVSIDTPSGTSSNRVLAMNIALDLGVTQAFVTDALARFKPPTRRDSTYEVHGVTVIDNSYNISPETAKTILEAAQERAQGEGKKLVAMTAGIAEQGHQSNKVNADFGLLLNKHSDRVILHPSCFMSAICSTLSVPYSVEEFALPVLESIHTYIDGKSEVLLHLPEHSDSVYF